MQTKPCNGGFKPVKNGVKRALRAVTRAVTACVKGCGSGAVHAIQNAIDDPLPLSKEAWKAWRNDGGAFDSLLSQFVVEFVGGFLAALGLTVLDLAVVDPLKFVGIIVAEGVVAPLVELFMWATGKAPCQDPSPAQTSVPQVALAMSPARTSDPVSLDYGLTY